MLSIISAVEISGKRERIPIINVPLIDMEFYIRTLPRNTILTNIRQLYTLAVEGGWAGPFRQQPRRKPCPHQPPAYGALSAPRRPHRGRRTADGGCVVSMIPAPIPEPGSPRATCRTVFTREPRPSQGFPDPFTTKRGSPMPRHTPIDASFGIERARASRPSGAKAISTNTRAVRGKSTLILLSLTLFALAFSIRFILPVHSIF